MESTAILIAAAVVTTTWLLGKIERQRGGNASSGTAPPPDAARQPVPDASAAQSSTVAQPTRVRPGIRLFAAAAGVLGLVFRLYGFDRSLWLDEFGTLWVVESDLSTVISRTLDFQGQSPFYYLLDWLFVSLLGESEFALRLPSLLCGVGTVYAVFELAKTLRGREAGLVASAFTWLSFPMVESSANARPYALALLMAALMLLGFAKAAVEGSGWGRLLFIVGGAGTFAAHYVLVTVALGPGLAYVFFRDLRKHYGWRKFAVDLAAMGILVLPTLPYLYSAWNRRAGLVWVHEPEFLAGLALVGALLVLACAGLVAGTLPPMGSERLALLRTMWLSIAAPVGILSLLAAMGTNLMEERYMSAILIPGFVLAAEGVLRLPKSLAIYPWSYWMVWTTLSFAVAAFQHGSFSQVGRQDWRAAVSHVDELVREEPGALVLYRSGFVEDDGRSKGPVSSATLAPLRSPGRPEPGWNIIPVTFRWSAPGREEYFERFVAPRMEKAPTVYFLSCQCYWEATGDFPVDLYEWVRKRFPGRFDAQVDRPGCGMFLMRYRRSRPPTPVPKHTPEVFSQGT